MPILPDLMLYIHHCRVFSADAGDCNVDIIFVLDSSGSIGSYNWYVTKQFVIDVILGMNANANMTRVGIITYSTTICREIELAAYTTDQLEQQVCTCAQVSSSSSSSKLMCD